MKVFPIIALVLLSACVVPKPRPMPLAESGPVTVEFSGETYLADLEPGETGTVLAVSRDEVPFRADEGLLAKRVAQEFCERRKSRVYPTAFGHFVNGSWTFEGGCI